MSLHLLIKTWLLFVTWLLWLHLLNISHSNADIKCLDIEVYMHKLKTDITLHV